MSLLLVEGVLVLVTISCKVSLFTTSVASNVWRIFSELVLFPVLIFVVMVVLLLFVVSSGVYCESLIFSCSHILFSCYESRLYFFTLFLESAKRDHLPSCTYFLNERVPWSWEAIQGSHHNLSFCIFFKCFKLFLDLRNPCEVGLYSLH